MGIKAGKLRERIVLLRPVTVRNDVGDNVVTLVDGPKIYAGISYAPGKEDLSKDQTSAKLLTTFEIRFRNEIGPKWGIRYNGQEFEIESVVPVGNREGLLLTGYGRDIRSKL